MEVAIAVAVGGAIIVWTYSMIAEGMKFLKESQHLNNAIHLSKIKMAQIDSATKLESDKTSGEVPGFPGYRFETEVREEEIDFLKLAQGKPAEEAKKKAPVELFQGKDSKMNDLLKARGKTRGSETGGSMKVFRVAITIFYPSAGKLIPYKTETFRSTKF